MQPEEKYAGEERRKAQQEFEGEDRRKPDIEMPFEEDERRSTLDRQPTENSQ